MKDTTQWFRMCVAAAKIDGEIAGEEREILRQLADRLDLSTVDAAEIYDQVLTGEQVAMPSLEREQSLELLRMVIEVTAADLIIEPDELKLVERLGNDLDLSTAELQELIDEAI